MLGYIYQCEYALYHLLDRDNRTSQISIETLDDIVAGPLADPQALLQLKLHKPNGDGVIRALTDRSPDLWKTIRVWATHIREKRIDPAKTTFLLLTTSPLGTQPGIAHLLGAVGGMLPREEKAAYAALQRLAEEILDTAKGDSDTPLVKGASAFLALSKAQRLDLVRNIVIVTGTPPIKDLRKCIEDRLRASGCTRESHPQFVQTIIGWWYGQCVEQIADTDGRTITFDALEQRLAETANNLALSGLPRYSALEQPTEADVAALRTRLFVRQLSAVSLGPESDLVRAAILDYYKADGHRKKWLEDLRIDRHEIASFEEDLRSIWATNFSVAEAEAEALPPPASPNSLNALGRKVVQQTLGAKAPSLKRFDGDYLGRGSYHIMANAPSIGWHPHWKILFPSSDPS